MKKNILAIILSASLLLSLAACGSTTSQQSEAAPASSEAASQESSASTAPAGEKVVLKLNHVQSNTDPVQAAFEEMSKKINERSNGTLEVQVYANSELGSNKDNLEQIKSGANIIAVADGALMADYVPDYSIMHGPFLYDSNDDLQKLYNSAWHKEIEQKASEHGIKVLAMNWYFGPRYIISKDPIESVEDLKGMKVRVPSAPMWAKTFETMGAVPTTLQWSEVYSALEQGVVDAAEAPLSTIYTSKLHEAVKNLTLTGHFTGIIGMEMSQQVWDSMTPEQQTILTEEVANQGKIYSQQVIDSMEEYKQKLAEEGVNIIEVDLAGFKEASKETYNKFPEWTPSLFDRIQKEMGK